MQTSPADTSMKKDGVATGCPPVAGKAAHRPFSLHVSWRQPEHMLHFSVHHALLNLVTFGLYHPFGKAELRRVLWNAVRINGEPMHYTGTGRELFAGFLILLGPFSLIAALWNGFVQAEAGNDPWLAALWGIPTAIVGFWIRALALHLAWAFRLRRTRWCHIGGDLAGNALTYANVYLATGLMLLLTLGLAWPWRIVRLRRILVGNMHFGGMHFALDADWRVLMPRFLPLWLTALPVLACGIWLLAQLAETKSISAALSHPSVPALAFALLIALPAWLSYKAEELNLLVNGTRIGPLKLRMTMTSTHMFHMFLRRSLKMLLSFGILAPMVHADLLGALIAHLDVEGEILPVDLKPHDDVDEAPGEGLASLLHIDGL